MKKVLFLINTLGMGGAEKVLVDTVNSLDHEKYDITVQTLYDDGILLKNLSSNVRYKTLFNSHRRLVKKVLRKLMFSLCKPRTIYSLLIKEKYDYEIAFLEGWPTRILSQSTNKKAKKIAWVHTDLELYADSYMAYGAEEKEAEAYSKFDKVVCVSKSVEQALIRKYGPLNTCVLYNVVDDQTITQRAKEAVCLPTKIRPCLVAVGRLVPQKGYGRLLRVHEKLVKNGYKHALMIVGDGPLRKEISEYIISHHLDETVFLLGNQENPYKYMVAADLVVCASIVEGFGMVISESVICGVPAISTDVSGCREPEIAPRCDIIMENDENAIYETLCELLSKPERIDQLKKDLPEKQRFLKKEWLVSEFEKNIFLD